jgi:hypothetical protein
MLRGMQTVIETPAYLRAAHEAGLGERERLGIVDWIARNPGSGVEIPGTGGCRKVRFAGRGKGKSGGYRVITFYTGSELPVFLLTVFAKGERSDLRMAERHELAKLTKALVESLRR